jgi:hypothetical protein
MSTVKFDVDKIYRAWREYLLNHSVCRNFAAFNDNSVAKCPASSIELIGSPTAESDLRNNEHTVNLSFKTTCAINNEKITQLYGMNDACRDFFNQLGFRQFGESVIQTNDNNIHEITSRFILRNFTGDFLIEL